MCNNVVRRTFIYKFSSFGALQHNKSTFFDVSQMLLLHRFQLFQICDLLNGASVSCRALT